jgi:hypothetical protein
MSALPPKADMIQQDRDVRLVQVTTIGHKASGSIRYRIEIMCALSVVVGHGVGDVRFFIFGLLV